VIFNLSSLFLILKTSWCWFVVSLSWLSTFRSYCMLEVVLSYCKHLMCKRWYISKYVCKAFWITWITIAKIIVVEFRIKYCWTKLCLFLDVRSEDHWSRSSCTRKSWRISVPAGKQCSPRVRFPQLSVQVSVQSVICSLQEKPIVTICFADRLSIMRLLIWTLLKDCDKDFNEG